MLRITIIEILLLSVPFILFFTYRAVVGARRRAAGAPIDETPYQLLFLAGALLSIALLVGGVLLRGGQPSNTDRVYIPPHSVDGRIVPGRFISQEEAEERGLLDLPPADRALEGEVVDPAGDDPEAANSGADER